MPNQVAAIGFLTSLGELLPLPQAWIAAHQIGLVVAGLVLAGAARGFGAWREAAACRWLEIAGWTQAAVATLRLIAWMEGFTVTPPLARVGGVVDIGVLMAIGGALAVAAGRRDLSHGRASLFGVLTAGAIAAACTGGFALADPFTRHAPAAVGQLLALGAAVLVLLRAQIEGLLRDRQEAVARCAWEEDQQHDLAAALEQEGAQRQELEAILESQRSAAVDSRRRTRTLERILTVSARLTATRDLPELLSIIVSATEEILGFRRVIVYLYSDSIQAFQARAFAGVDGADQARLANHQISQEEYDALTEPRFRYSNCFLQSRDPTQADHPIDGGGATAAAIAGGYVPSESGRSWTASPTSTPQSWRTEGVLIAPLVDGAGDTRGYLSVARPRDDRVPSPLDIRQLEFLVRQAATAIEAVEMYDRLARQNAELAQASEKLKSLGVMKTNFVANVSHELRTPLTSISAYTELLQRDTDEMTGEVRREFLRVINQESGKLTRIIDDLLELSRMEDGNVRLDKTCTDLSGLMSRLADSWRRRAEQKRIDITLTLPPDRIELEADPLLLEQLLDHLVSNACKFTPEEGRVRIGAEECGTAVRLTVEDNGIGIPADQLDAIFERFYQVDASATRQHNGQGVGLALCQDIVGYHDGRIWVENVTPRGARFTVLLPRRPAVVQPVVRQRTAPALGDANQFMQRLMHWICESLGVQTVTLMVPDESHERLTIRAAIGVPESVVQSSSVRRGGGFAGKAWVTGRSLLIEDVHRDRRFRDAIDTARYATPSVLCVPLVHDLDVIGIVTVNNRIDGRPLDEDDQRLLEAMAPRITDLLRMHRAHEESVREFAAVQASLRATTLVGHLQHEHVTAVCHEICLAAARAIELPDEEIEHLAFALQFYDVGMSAVPAHLLHQVEPLSEDERREIAKHVPASLAILAPLRPPGKVRQIINHHHENYNGSGYPEGLTGEAIPLGARLLRLTDTLNAVLRRRPYRESLSVNEALAEIRAGIGSFYCPRLTPIFLAETERRRERLEGLTETHRDAVDLARSARRLPAAPARV